jgi:C-terminal processing protease CtpA/Prc
MRTDFRTAAGRGAFALAVILAVAILSSLSLAVPLPAQDLTRALIPATALTVRPEYAAQDGGFVTAAADTFRLEGPLPMPRRVAVLTDRGCASSCEAFVLAARQSDKVTLYGDNTGGLTDYGNVITDATPHPALRLYVPTARSNRLPEESYDVVGIPPHVRLPSEVLYPLKWVREQLREGR